EAEARAALSEIGLPAIIRPSFTLGGTGGGIAYNTEEFDDIIRGGLRASPTHEVLVEESVLGWQEYELEIVRDRADNCIVVCSCRRGRGRFRARIPSSRAPIPRPAPHASARRAGRRG